MQTMARISHYNWISSDDLWENFGYNKSTLEEKLLLSVHDDCISLLKLKMVRPTCDNEDIIVADSIISRVNYILRHYVHTLGQHGIHEIDTLHARRLSYDRISAGHIFSSAWRWTHARAILMWRAITYYAAALNLPSIIVPKSHLIDASKREPQFHSSEYPCSNGQMSPLFPSVFFDVETRKGVIWWIIRKNGVQLGIFFIFTAFTLAQIELAAPIHPNTWKYFPTEIGTEY